MQITASSLNDKVFQAANTIIIIRSTQACRNKNNPQEGFQRRSQEWFRTESTVKLMKLTWIKHGSSWPHRSFPIWLINCERKSTLNVDDPSKTWKTLYEYGKEIKVALWKTRTESMCGLRWRASVSLALHLWIQTRPEGRKISLLPGTKHWRRGGDLLISCAQRKSDPDCVWTLKPETHSYSDSSSLQTNSLSNGWV